MMIAMRLRNRILLGYLPAMLLMAAVCAAVIWNVRTMNEASESVERAHAIVDSIKDVHNAALEAQKSERGYILVKNEISKEGYRTAIIALRGEIRTLGTLIRDPQQLENLRVIAETAEELSRFTGKLMELVDAGDTAQAVQIYATNAGTELGRKLENLTEAFEKREIELMLARQKREDGALSALVVQVLTFTGVAIVIAMAGGWLIAARISRNLVEVVTGMSTSSTEIAATVDEHERVVIQQAAAVTQTTRTVEELSVSSRQTAAQAESASESARQALEVTQTGIRLAGEVSTGMADMQQKANSVAGKILRLSEHAEQIGSIARVVGELADETNMLALNAAVEAAHAGEHGKGFAVVAAEVRKLADQSKKSAARAHALVTEIQKATNSAVMETGEASNTAEAAAATVGTMIASFSSISDMANRVAVSGQQVLLNSRQQAAALAQVSEAMRSIAAGSSQMAAGTAQTKRGMDALSGVALQLKAMV